MCQTIADFVDLPAAKLRVRYEIRGQGVPLVLVHGVGARLDNWYGVVDRLAPHFQVISYDLRGHGDTTRAPGPYSLDLFAADLAELLDQLGIERCHLAGHSLGGMIGQRFALDHPDRLDRLAILSSAAGRTPEERERVLARVDTVRQGGGAHFERSISRWFTDAFRQNNPDLIADYLDRNKLNDPDCYSAAYRVLATSDLGDDLHRIAAPTLVATGEEDIGSSPRMARLMAERIPDARLCILDGLRHSILVEAPDLVAGLLLDFLTPQGGAPTGR